MTKDEDAVERVVAQAIVATFRRTSPIAARDLNMEWGAWREEARAAIRAMRAADPSTAEKLEAEILRLVDALVFAHDAGFEWPVDPLPFGSIAHNLFIERGNDPERIAAKIDGSEQG
jgi:hypothetical protein